MSQFMEVMIGQQSILMSLANVVPPVPEQPTGPIASQPVAPPQPAPVVTLPVQHLKEWDIDEVSRDAFDILEVESIEAEIASQHSEQDIKLQMLDTDDPTWSGVERATHHLGIEWPMTELPRRSLFESPSAQAHQSRMLPAFPDFIKEVQSTWGALASAPTTSRKASAFNMQGASGTRKRPACVPLCGSQKRVGDGQSAAGEVGPARAQGRSIASLVVARRQLWLSQARVQEPDKVPLLDAPITSGHTYGPVVEEMLQRSVKAREALQQMEKMWPNKPFQPKEEMRNAPSRRGRRCSKWRKCGQTSRSSRSGLRNISGAGQHHSSRRNHGAVRSPLQVHQRVADPRL
ncbi:UNVERIFIED_CONTAM: hypothetical protein FKN15_053288 [Acipenser sinensis]